MCLYVCEHFVFNDNDMYISIKFAILILFCRFLPCIHSHGENWDFDTNISRWTIFGHIRFYTIRCFISRWGLVASEAR